MEVDLSQVLAELQNIQKGVMLCRTVNDPAAVMEPVPLVDGVIQVGGNMTFSSPDYILVDGTRSMTGPWDMGPFVLTAAGFTADVGPIKIEAQGEVRWYEGANYVGFQAPTLAADQIWKLPTADGAANDAIITDGAGNLSFFAPAPALHAVQHENGGADEINVAGLSGLLADDQNPLDHAIDHENGGGDEINLGGLSGVPADVLALAGGTMAGNIVMGDNSITGINALSGTDYIGIDGAVTSHALASGLVTGPLEVNGLAYFDNRMLSFYTGGLELFRSSSFVGNLGWVDDDGLHLSVRFGTRVNTNLIFCTTANYLSDFGKDEIAGAPTFYYTGVAVAPGDQTEHGAIRRDPGALGICANEQINIMIGQGNRQWLNNDVDSGTGFGINTGVSILDGAPGTLFSPLDTFIKFGDATNYGAWAADGEYTMAGTARVKKKIIIATNDLSKGGTAPDQTTIGNYIGYSYDKNDDSVLSTELPTDWAVGTDVEFEADWAIDETYATANGEVQWEVLWSATPHDMTEPLDAPTHTGTLDSGDINIPAIAKSLTETSIGTISGASLSASDELGFTFSRVNLDGGVDPTADPVVINVYLVYTSDRLGATT